jgi:hypothetical protein
LEERSFYPEAGGMGIIIVGYPKSGNTWITRLVADVICCPVAGFWNDPTNKDIAIEGAERSSPHRVYKSHRVAAKFVGLPENYRVIYLVRDPRDVACSGANYFNVRRFRENKVELAHYDKYEAMVDVIVNGGVYAHTRKPWGRHVTEFTSTVLPGTDVRPLVVRYEDMVAKPVNELTLILRSLGLDRSLEELEKSIVNQSFSAMKARESAKSNGGRPRFFRKGRPGSFREELRGDLIEKIESPYAAVMTRFGYELAMKTSLRSIQ